MIALGGRGLIDTYRVDSQWGLVLRLHSLHLIKEVSKILADVERFAVDEDRSRYIRRSPHIRQGRESRRVIKICYVKFACY
jgi:hypothetical protein